MSAARLCAWLASGLFLLSPALVLAQEPKEEEEEEGAPGLGKDPAPQIEAPEAQPEEAKDDNKEPEKAAKDEDENPEGDQGGAVPVPKTLQKTKVGVYVSELGKFDISTGTVNAEFYLGFSCDEGVTCRTDFDLWDGKITSKEEIDNTGDSVTYKIKAELNVDVDLARYPFDKHEITISLADTEANAKEVQFVVDPEDIELDERVKLPGWQISEPDAAVENIMNDVTNQEASVYSFTVEIQRFTFSVFMKNFLPVLFTVFVMSLGLLLKPKSASARLAMATGALAATATFHLSSTSSLPPLGYTTLVDKFMFSTYLLIFGHILVSVFLLKLDERKEEAKSETLYRAAQPVLPVVTIALYVLVLSGVI